MKIKAMFMNYFKEGKIYQWDEKKEVYIITENNFCENKDNSEFCLEKTEMEKLLKFDFPHVQLDGCLKVKSGKMRANLKLVDEKLVTPNLEFTGEFTIAIEKLKIANKFVGDVNERPVLQGINIANNCIMATDGYFAYRTECKNQSNIVVHSSYLKILKDLKGEITFKHNDNIVCCEVDNTLYIGRLLSEKFPNLDGIYNQARYNNINFEKDELEKLLSFSSDKDDIIIFDKNKFKIISNYVNENYDFEADIECNLEESLCLPLRKLSTIISLINESNITIQYSDVVKPVTINNEFLILPLRFNKN